MVIDIERIINLARIDLTSGVQVISNMGCEKNIFNLTKKMNDIILNL
jgi:hypothetical protein